MKTMDEIGVTVPPPAPRRAGFFAKDRIWLNAVLLALTLGSAFWVGLSWSSNYIFAGAIPSGGSSLGDSRVVGLSLVYALALGLILIGHEMGHFLACRRFGISVTLPFFIPAPTLIGTMGAFIKIRAPITQKRQLFDIGAAGPLAGFVLALPAVVIGLALSKAVPSIPRGESIIFGEPLLLKFIGLFVFRGIGPGFDIILHPLAFAGWVGILVTALNLLPLGQLDGGHISYAVFGLKSRLVARVFLIVFAVMGVFFWVGWFVWALLILVLGLKHPRVWDEPSPLGRGRTITAVLLFFIFLICFIPDPVKGFDLIRLIKGL
jgi:membrane-associated protease RseP (regulator of RpoE activity)